MHFPFTFALAECEGCPSFGKPFLLKKSTLMDFVSDGQTQACYSLVSRFSLVRLHILISGTIPAVPLICLSEVLHRTWDSKCTNIVYLQQRYDLWNRYEWFHDFHHLLNGLSHKVLVWASFVEFRSFTASSIKIVEISSKTPSFFFFLGR